MTAALESALARLLRRCEIQPTGCVVWTGCINSSGYGVIGYAGNRVLTLDRAITPAETEAWLTTWAERSREWQAWLDEQRDSA